MILQLTKAEAHAVRFCVYLAGHDGRWVPTREAAKAQGIPERSAWHVVRSLVRGDVIVGRSGRGYRLTKRPDELGVDDVLKAMRPNMGSGESLIGPGEAQAEERSWLDEMRRDVDRAVAVSLEALAELRFGEDA